MVDRILVISPNYPYKEESVYPFVKNLCDQFSKMGIGVTVLSPQSITSSILHRRKIRPLQRIDKETGVKIYQPYYISVPHRLHDVNNFLLRLSIRFFLMKHKIKYDLIYCHFWSSAHVILPYAKSTGLPLYVATGESVITNLFKTRFGVKELCDCVNGVICVSSKNKEESISLGLTKEEKCVVIPNAINASIFYKRNKAEIRRELGIAEDAFIVAFVGWFIERKGPIRVARALQKIEGVSCFFIGKGEQDPECNNILFKGALPHNDIPLYLNAADVFVLPTLHEGCCNAVIEAMACGLPVVSSNLPFNWDVLDSSNSIMVNPNDIDEIASAIKLLKEDGVLRNRLSIGALEKAKTLSIDKRATAILNFFAQ